MIKKITSLFMAVALVAVIGTAAFAVGKVEKIEQGIFVESIEYKSGDKYEVGKVLSNVEKDFAPGETINIFLDPSKFVGTDVKFTPETGMSVKDLESAGVSIRVSGGNNSNLIQSASLKEKEISGKNVALIQLKITETLVSTEKKEFDTKVSIYSNKVKQQDITVGGTVGGSAVTVDSSNDYISLSNGEIVEAAENISSIEVDAGNDVSLFAKMYKGKKYSAVAHDNLKDSDIKLITDFAELDTVYYLDTAGFTGADVEVKIKTPSKLFVYDENGKKLGTTDDRLALSSKYYLAKSEIDLKLSGSSTVTTTDDDNSLEPEPGDGSYVEPLPGDDSEIPNTGIGVMPKIALAAVVGGLATIGVIISTGSKKKK